MIYDPTPRWKKSLDALSQFVNVTFLPRHVETTSNESVSGRSHRLGWTAERFIDWLFLPFEREHCRKSYEADVQRAKQLISNERRSRERSEISQNP